MKRLILAISLLFSAFFPITSAEAAETLIFNNTTTCAGWGPGTTAWAYRMYAASASTITAMEVPYGGTSGASATTLAIYSTSGSGPATLLGTFNYSSLTGNIARFTGTANLSVGDFYWVYRSSSTSDPCSAGVTANSTGSGWTMSQYRYTSTNIAGPFSYDSGGGSASMIQLKIYTSVPDSTPPTFPTPETFTVAENSTSVGSIKVSESATISIFGGADQAKFTLAQTDSVTANLAFQSAPNFESPTDTGLDNTYQVVLKAVDPSGNSGYETITATVTDVDENARVISYTLSGTQSKGSILTLVATVNFAAKVTFMANGKRIPGCISKATSGTSPITVTCNWKVATSGNIPVMFKVVPTASNLFATTSSPVLIKAERRSSLR